MNVFRDMFEKHPSPPFSQSIEFDINQTENELFEQFNNLFMYGLLVLNKYENFEIKHLTIDNIDTMKNHFLSFGINLKYTFVKKNNLNDLHITFLDELTLEDSIDVFVCVNWKTNKIINAKVITNESNRHVIQQIAKSNMLSNYILDIFKPSTLQELIKCYMYFDEIVYFNFSFANIGDFHLYNRCY